MRRRSALRVRVNDVSAKVRMKGFPFSRGREEQQARVVDIGPKGMGLELDRAIPEDTKISCVIDISEDRKFRCKGLVRNHRKTDDGYAMGIEFTKLSRRGRTFLSDSKNILDLAQVDFMESRMLLKDKIRQLRKTLGLTVVELAQISSVSPIYLMEFENGGEEEPSLEFLTRLARGMGLTLADISGQGTMDSEGVPTWFLPAPKAPKGHNHLDWARFSDSSNI